MACPYHKTAAPAPVAPLPSGQTMKAIWVEEFGGPEVLKLKTDVPVPVPGDKEILIKVFTIGVNPVETFCCAGSFTSIVPSTPFIPGGDVAGVVQQVGSKVTKFMPGEKVYTFGRALNGGYAAYATFPESEVFSLHEDMQFSQGAAIGIPYFTAYRALFIIGKAKPGDVVLVHGASGGVGVAACQVARAHGLRVLGTAGSEEGMDIVLKAGAHLAFNHREEGYMQGIKMRTEGQGVNIVLEMAASVNLASDLDLLARHGRIIVVGSAIPLEDARFDPLKLILSENTIHGIELATCSDVIGGRGSIEIKPTMTTGGETCIQGLAVLLSTDEELQEMGAAMYSGMEQGWLRPVIGQEFPLEQAADAHREVQGHMSGSRPGSRGKVILSI